jgi:transposase
MSAAEEEIREIYKQGEDECVAWTLNTLNELLSQVEELKKRRGATSKNSSMPSSQDPFREKPKPKKQKKRKRNHHNGGRKLVPAPEVQERHNEYPANCGGCGLPLTPLAQHIGEAGRYQQTEIPEAKAYTIEWLIHALRCGGCGHTTKAAVPPEAKQRFGPRLKTAIATLGADKRQTGRQLQQLLSDYWGIHISIGQIVNITREVGELLKPAAARLKQEILTAKAIFADETSWRVNRAKAYIWAIFSKTAAYYEIHDSRKGEVAEQLIPLGHKGTVHTDDYGGYNHIKDKLRQLCWAHIKRHFQKRAEADDESEREFGERGIKICARVFKLSKQSTERQRKRVIADLRALVAEGLTAEATDGMRRTAKTLRKRDGNLWHCLYHDHIEATNNHAERMLRPAVIKRKLSFGSGSVAGAQALAALLSITATARMRGQSPYAFIEATVRAAQKDQELPQMA